MKAAVTISWFLRVFAILAVVLVHFSCEKILFDDRNKYSGDDWKFEVKSQGIEYPEYQGRIYYKGVGNEVFIEYAENTFLVVTIKGNGQLLGTGHGFIRKAEMEYSIQGGFSIIGWR